MVASITTSQRRRRSDLVARILPLRVVLSFETGFFLLFVMVGVACFIPLAILLSLIGSYTTLVPEPSEAFGFLFRFGLFASSIWVTAILEFNTFPFKMVYMLPVATQAFRRQVILLCILAPLALVTVSFPLLLFCQPTPDHPFQLIDYPVMLFSALAIAGVSPGMDALRLGLLRFVVVYGVIFPSFVYLPLRMSEIGTPQLVFGALTAMLSAAAILRPTKWSSRPMEVSTRLPTVWLPPIKHARIAYFDRIYNTPAMHHVVAIAATTILLGALPFAMDYILQRATKAPHNLFYLFGCAATLGSNFFALLNAPLRAFKLLPLSNFRMAMHAMLLPTALNLLLVCAVVVFCLLPNTHTFAFALAWLSTISIATNMSFCVITIARGLSLVTGIAFVFLAASLLLIPVLAPWLIPHDLGWGSFVWSSVAASAAIWLACIQLISLKFSHSNPSRDW